MPAIPFTIVNKLDEFFRLVDAQHGTESIVLLTFDPSKNDSSGWGILVPEQTNTSVHCKYDAESIAEIKPEHIMIVGSVHSHPKMAAYASGTDHEDQADFDGLHITFGWQASVNGGATQYHIEMQMAGQAWTLKPEDVFESFTITKAPDPEVVEWTSKVKKAVPPTGGSATPVASVQTVPQTTTHTQGSTQTGIKPKQLGDPSLQDIPKINDPNPYVVIAEIDYSDNNASCPSCEYSPSYQDLLEDVCPVCDICFADNQYSYSDIIKNTEKYLQSRNQKVDITYYMWIKDFNDQDMMIMIYSPFENIELPNETKEVSKSYLQLDQNSYSSLSDYNDDYTDKDFKDLDLFYYSDFDQSRLVCCNLPVNDANHCECPQTVFFSMLDEFDDAHPLDIYDQSGNCASCEYYYSRHCSPYHAAIMDYARFREPLETKIQDCENFSPYSTFENYAFERD
jgi:hypothetical protein